MKIHVMRSLFFAFLSFICGLLVAQDDYERARLYFDTQQLDSARFFINKRLVDRPTPDDYFLSAMIYEAEGKNLRALADYEAVVQNDPSNIEAYFQKALIYYHAASTEKAIEDFSYVIAHQPNSETNAIYYAIDPHGVRGTYLSTLQSMLGRVYQYRGMAYEKMGEWEKALADFSKTFAYDTTIEGFINRSQLYAKMGNEALAIQDLKLAIGLDSGSYLAWYNLAILDESTQLPSHLMEEEAFAPLLNLVGANAYENGDFHLSATYYAKALEANPNDDLAFIGRGKARLRLGDYSIARGDFMRAMQLNPQRIEALYLIGNTLFHEKNYKEALGFYDQYLSVDRSYANVWFNAAMALLSLDKKQEACRYLRQADKLGMSQVVSMLEKHCDNP